MRRQTKTFDPESPRSSAPRPIHRLPFALTFVIVLLALAPATAFAAGSALTEPASKVHHTTAVLNGHLDSEADPGVVECRFEWGETLAYGNITPCAEGDAFVGPADVSARLDGLSPATTYHFRLHIKTTSNGSLNGADRSFETQQVPFDHPLIASFGKDGTSGSSFGAEVSPAINQATRRLYVAERGPESGRLYGFNASAPPAFTQLGGFPVSTLGNQLPPMPIAVDSTGLGSAGNVYFATWEQTPHAIKLYGVDSSGASLPGFPIDPLVNPGAPIVKDSVEPVIWGIAVDSSGEVWITTQRGRILKYSPAGVFTGSIDVSAQPGEARRVAFDSDDNLYVAFRGDPLADSTWKFTAASGYSSASQLSAFPANISGFAYDPSTEYLYVNSVSGTVDVYDVSGDEFFDEILAGGSNGVAVDPANHAIYVGGSDKIRVYATGAALSPPTATTAPASAVAGSTATLNGFVDPEGQAVSECKFEYRAASSSVYNKTVPCSSIPGSGSGDAAVSAEISGLTPNTVYHFRLVAANASATGKGLDATFTTNPPPVISSPSVEDLTYNSATLEALVNPKGFETTYRFEYGTTTAYGSKIPVPDASVGAGSSDVPVSVHLSGLSPDTIYHWRVVAENTNGTATTPDATFTSFGPVKAETTGSPIRTATTAQLQGRVDPDGAPSSFHFEYGTQGPCDANPCTATPDRSAGSGGVYEFATEPIEGLQANTTYHYRLISESPTPGSPGVGEDMTVTTRASDAPLSHGHFPGPPDSDRAYEQVSLPDTGGNPVNFAYIVSDDGNRAFYRVSGGTPISNSGSLLTQLFAERTSSGWRSENVGPPRDQLLGSLWLEPIGRHDLSAQISFNVDSTGVKGTALWRLRPGQPAVKIFESGISIGPVIASESASRVVATMKGSQDPAHPVPAGVSNVYDVSSGTPQLVGLLPDGSVSACGSEAGAGGSANLGGSDRNWLSADGSLAFFQSCSGLYVRDFTAGQTKQIAPGSGSFLVKSIPGAVFFVTSASLAPGDSGGSDLYRYGLEDESLKCLSCVVPGLNANVSNNPVAVASDGSRVYFKSPTALVPGAATPAIYRVNVQSGDFAYVAPVGFEEAGGSDPRAGEAIAADGSALVFASSDPGMNAIGGQQNNATQQFYRYDDRDRSVTCLSCPQNGEAPATKVPLILANGSEGAGVNRTSFSADGSTFAFATANALLPADQNTARPGQKADVGTDIYEWRDGRLLLITDGLTNWPGEETPKVSAITPSGNDVFFTAPAQYTQDALDGYSRLYDARIGGGFEFPPPPKACPLEVCQGTPKGAPEEQAPGTGSFAGPGKSSQAKKPHPHKKKHKKKHKKQNRQAKHNRGAHR